MSIEESIQQIKTLIEAWQLDEADLNQTDINAMQTLLKENQELKQKYLNAVADYETTMFEKERLNSLVNSCQEEIRQLKKQLRTSAIFNEEDIRLDQTKEVFETLANILNTESCSYRYLIYDLLGFKKENYIDLIAGMSITNAIVELEELETQQKEFIKYLENEKDRLARKHSNICKDKFDEVDDILQKYKEIIGAEDDTN